MPPRAQLAHYFKATIRGLLARPRTLDILAWELMIDPVPFPIAPVGRIAPRSRSGLGPTVVFWLRETEAPWPVRGTGMKLVRIR